MATREELELLASRQLDGDLDAAQHAALQAALADPAFAEWFDDLKRAHKAMAEFANANAVPAGVATGVADAIDGKVHALPPKLWKLWVSVAAVLVLAAALLAISGVLGGGDADPNPPIATSAYTQLDIEVISTGDVRVIDAEKTASNGRDYKARVSLPATVRAPAGTHAQVYVGGGTAVLKSGTVVTLTEANGVAQIEPVQGDLYLESRADALASRLGEWAVRLERAGLVLRQKGGVPTAEPAFGTVSIGDQSVAYHQVASIADGRVQVQATQNGALEDWAISGRMDAIRREMQVLLGDKYAALQMDFQDYWGPPIRGVISRPADAATSAMLIRLFEQHLWLPEWGENERQALRNLADIVGEGTTEDDVPQRIREEIAPYRELALKYPDAARQFIRGMLEQRKTPKPEGSVPDPRDPG
jgi:hypothetical protein